MFLSVFITECVKYRRSLIPWLALIGGFFPVMVAVLFIVTSDTPAAWETLAARGVEFFNMLALLFVAIIAGNAFVMEYHQNGANRMHLYPVPRVLQFVVKLLVAALYVLLMHLLFLAFMALSGLCFAKDSLMPGAAGDWLRLLLLVAAANILLMSPTALVGIVFKKPAAYILWGMGSFIIFMGFAGSNAARYVLPCVPGEILIGYLQTGAVMQAESGEMFLVSAAVSAVILCIGGLCYVRMER